MNASKPFGHPTNQAGKISKRLGKNKGSHEKISSSWAENPPNYLSGILHLECFFLPLTTFQTIPTLTGLYPPSGGSYLPQVALEHVASSHGNILHASIVFELLFNMASLAFATSKGKVCTL